MKNISKYFLFLVLAVFLMLPAALSAMTGWSPQTKEKRKSQTLRLKETAERRALVSQNFRENKDADLLNSLLKKD